MLKILIPLSILFRPGLFCAAVVLFIFNFESVASVPDSVRGSWKMIEQFCVAPGKREKIAPGFPGSLENWSLEFLDSGSAGQFRYEAIYHGIGGNDCHLFVPGEYELEHAANGKLTDIGFSPSRGAVRKSGSFEAPCKVLSSTRAQKFEARIERVKNAGGLAVDRIRMQGPDTEARCEDGRERMELLFERTSP